MNSSPSPFDILRQERQQEYGPIDNQPSEEKISPFEVLRRERENTPPSPSPENQVQDYSKFQGEDSVGRAASRAVKYVASLPGAVADTVNSFANLPIKGVNAIAETEIPEFSTENAKNIDQFLDSITKGYTTTPENEKWIREGAKLALETYLFGGASSLIKNTGTAANTAKNALSFVGSTNPGTVAAAGGFGAGSELAHEAGSGALGSLAGGIAGAALTGLPGAAVKSVKKSLNPSQSLAELGANSKYVDINEKALNAAKEFDTELPLFLASDSKAITVARDYLKENPFFSDSFRKAAKESNESFAKGFQKTSDDYLNKGMKDAAGVVENEVISVENLQSFINDTLSKNRFKSLSGRENKAYKASEEIIAKITRNNTENASKEVQEILWPLDAVTPSPQEASQIGKEFFAAEKAAIKSQKNQRYQDVKESLTPETKGIPEKTINLIKEVQKGFKSLSYDDSEKFIIQEMTNFLKKTGALKETPDIQKLLGQNYKDLNSEFINKNMETILKALNIEKPSLKNITVEELIGTRRSYASKIKHNYEIEGAKSFMNRFIKSVEDDIADITARTNPEVYNKFKDADQYFKENVVDRVRSPIGKGILNEKTSKNAYDYLNKVEDVKKLEKVFGNSEKAQEILLDLKTAKTKEVFLDKVFTPSGDLNIKAYEKFFSQKSSNQDLLKELVGKERFDALKDLANNYSKKNQGLSTEEIGSYRRELLNAMDSKNLDKESKNIFEGLLKSSNNDLRTHYKGDKVKYKNYLTEERNRNLTDKQEKFRDFFGSKANSFVDNTQVGNEVKYKKFSQIINDPENAKYLESITDKGTYNKLKTLSEWAEGIAQSHSDVTNSSKSTTGGTFAKQFKELIGLPTVFALGGLESGAIYTASKAAILTSQNIATKVLTDKKYLNYMMNFKNSPTLANAKKAEDYFYKKVGIPLSDFLKNLQEKN